MFILPWRRIYANELTEEERHLEGLEFKSRQPEKRAAMKTCTLAMIYGSGKEGLASQLGESVAKADQLITGFLELFPALALAKERAANCSAVRGYASAISGLRRYRGSQGTTTGWERRWLVNFPVQGSAAVVFKMAGNRLDRQFQSYGATLLLPVHDSFVFEVPTPVLEEVAALTERVMCEAVRECFPQLKPSADINIFHPDCWNKEGNVGSVERWISEGIQK